MPSRLLVAWLLQGPGFVSYPVVNHARLVMRVDPVKDSETCTCVVKFPPGVLANQELVNDAVCVGLRTYSRFSLNER